MWVNRFKVAVCLGLVASLCIWNLPPGPATTPLRATIAPWIYSLGFFQNWRMFAGDTTGDEFSPMVRIVIEDSSGVRKLLPEYEWRQPTWARSVLRGVAYNSLLFWPGDKLSESFLRFFCRHPGHSVTKPRKVFSQVAWISIQRLGQPFKASGLSRAPLIGDSEFQNQRSVECPVIE